jgi:hypothetical protein
MAEGNGELSPEEMNDLVRAQIARDDRYAAIDIAIKVNDALQNNAAWEYILKRAQLERDEALAKLAEVPPHDQNAIRSLQHRARFVTAMQQWLKEIDDAAKTADEDIKRQDGLLQSDA